MYDTRPRATSGRPGPGLRQGYLPSRYELLAWPAISMALRSKMVPFLDRSAAARLRRRGLRPCHRRRVGGAGAAISSPPPLSLPLPDIAAAVTPAVCRHLDKFGWAVVDGAFGETWCHLLRDDLITLAERQLLQLNATHLVRPDGTTDVLAKHHIFEAGIPAAGLDHSEASPRLAQLWGDAQLCDRLDAGVMGGEGRLHRQTLKAQLNAGGGACFPLHFDSDRAVDGRAITAILYLNPGWTAADGGQLRLQPVPGKAVDIEPLFGARLARSLLPAGRHLNQLPK